MTYEYPSGVNNTVDLLLWMNNVVDWFGLGLLIMIFSIAFLSTLRYGGKRAFAVASWLSLITCFLMFPLGIISLREVIFAIVGVSVSVIWLWLSSD